MIDSTTSQPGRPVVGQPTGEPSPAQRRAERRRLTESIRAHRRLLVKRPSFEVSDRRRLNREARERDRADQRHGKALQRIHERRVRKEQSLARQLNGLDGNRERRERRALAVLRRESIERALRSTYLSASEVNGIGRGLVRDLAAQGIRTAADFHRVSWGKAPNGRGGDVLYIHRVQGRKVHINGIGEHRGRPLMEWRKAALARAEARAPHELPPDERHRIAEIIENERTRIQGELDEAPGIAEAARAEAVQAHAEMLERLDSAEREAAGRAALRRAEFDEMAERLLALQNELSAHVTTYGNLGLRDRRAHTRAMRPAPAVPTLPAIPSPRRPGTPGTPGTPEHAPHAKVSLAKATDTAVPSPTPGIRASLGWLLPIVFFGVTVALGAGEPDGVAPLWSSITTRLMALAMVAELLRLWIPRRRPHTAGPMPSGTGPLCIGTFLALAALSMFADPENSGGGAPWAVSVVSLLLLLAGATLRTDNRKSDGARNGPRG
ncbi:hypothetical protein [Streptomyces avermitilis]|uniref:hypothetical protein n=1 Tax=Streptomyces avermitilis TaxID=33903 RepID=UPI003682FD73